MKKKAFVSMFAIFFSAIVVSILTSMYLLLIKQIEIMNIDSSSFQALYTADSAFECLLFKEQNATTSASSVLFNGNAGNCAGNTASPDLEFVSGPTNNAGAKDSVLKMKITTDQGDFCAVVSSTRQPDNVEISNKMVISGQNRVCEDESGKRVVARLVEFFY